MIDPAWKAEAPRWYRNLLRLEYYALETAAWYWLLWKCWLRWGDTVGIVGLFLLAGMAKLTLYLSRDEIK